MKWRSLFESILNHFHGDRQSDFVLREGCADGEIEDLLQFINCSEGHEMLSIYKECNGYGMSEEASATDPLIDWYLLPKTSLPDAKERASAWFVDTHPEIAERFFPIEDWRSGDFLGYMRDIDGVLRESKVYAFFHDEYNYEPSQFWGEFIQLQENGYWEYSLEQLSSDVDE